MTLRRVQFFQKISLLVFIARFRGIKLLPTAFYRTRSQQQALFAIGRTTELDRNPVTNCDGVNKISKHQIWEALDFVIVRKGSVIWTYFDQYKSLGKIAEKIGLRWGGNWDQDDTPGEPGEHDIYHFELAAK